MNPGKIIQQLRNTNGISQGQLAEQMAVSVQDVSNWETGAAIPEIHDIVKLSQIFGVSTDYLLKGNIDNNSALFTGTNKSGNNSGMEEDAFMLVYTEEMLDHYNNKVRVVVGGIFTLFGFGGVLFFLIFSSINPIIYSVGVTGNLMNETIYTGLRAFLLSNNAVWLFVLCCIIGAIGLGTLFSADLRGFTWNYEDRENPNQLNEEEGLYPGPDPALDPEVEREMTELFQE